MVLGIRDFLESALLLRNYGRNLLGYLLKVIILDRILSNITGIESLIKFNNCRYIYRVLNINIIKY